MIERKSERMIRPLMLTDPSALTELEELVEFLQAILTGPFSALESDGELKLVHIRALVANVRGLKIQIYPDEHPPPHFLVKSANIDAIFTIDNCELVDGRISGRANAIIGCWHQYSKEILIDKWNSMRPQNARSVNIEATRNYVA
jgi:hypothetical protein